MNQEERKQAAGIIIAAVHGAIIDKTDTMLDYLAEAFEAVKADDHGNKKSSITIPIKLKLQRSAREGDRYSARAIVQKNKREIGECEMTFNPDQPDLPMGDSAAGNGTVEIPDEQDFYDRLAKFNIEEVELDAYFAGSNRWNDFEGWLSAGNGGEADRIMKQDPAAQQFVALVKATLHPNE